MTITKNSESVTLPNIKTNNLILCLPEIQEAELMCNFHIENKKYFSPWEPQKIDIYYSENYWREQIQKIRAEFFEDKSCCLNIYEKETHKLVGIINYSNFIRGAFHSCFLGFKISEKMQNRGYMTQAIQGSTVYIFDQLNLHRIAANYMPRNAASAKVLKKCSFKQDGIADDYLCINGKWEPHILTSLINKNWVKMEGNYES